MSLRRPASLWRAMGKEDIGSVIRLAEVIHPDYPEEDAVFMERFRLCPEGCFVTGAPVRGYLLSHPWSGEPPFLGSLLGALPSVPECWYLHDIALLPEARGEGHATAALDILEKLARQFGLDELRLVSTQQAFGFWLKQGFVVRNEISPALLSYGEGARLMARKISD